MDSFFEENLRSIVDTSRRPWRWLGGGLGIPVGVLTQFQRAATIKEAFFLGGGQTPSVSFELRPLTMDPQVSQFILDLEGQIVEYRHGPPRISKLQWPGPQGTGRVRVVLVDALGNRRSIAEEGPWAWFRLLDRVRVEPSAQPELFEISFEQAGLEARWEMRAISVLNPFRLEALNLFRCPERL
jgi:type VI secretion system protein ImpL